VHFGPMFGAFGGAMNNACLTFVSKASIEAGIKRKFGLTRQLAAVAGTRKLSKKSMVWNDYTPTMEVDPETYQVRADGQLLTCKPAAVLPMAQRYFLF
jgi:urease subunit alpha